MFSGIVEELGSVRSIARRGVLALLEVKADAVLGDVKIGDSISVDGVCLTITGKTADSLCFEAMPETMQATALGSLKIADRVNLERSLKVGDRISGHFVTGHIDCIGIIRQKKHIRGNAALDIAVPAQFLRYVVPKGSIAIDGISLTVMRKGAGTLSVYVIPHTQKNTTLGFKGPSHKVNVEFDILAKKP